VFTNLLNNACKYTHDGGCIWIAAHEENGQAVVYVRDNGIGMEAELLPQVFDLFTQGERSLDRSQGGLGIGLTLVHSLVEMHSGTVTARSDGHGTGSEFTVRLPIATPLHEPRGPHDQPFESPTIAPRSILIVEDNPVAAQILALLLERSGSHRIDIAHDGETGLELAKACRPDLVLTDIGLPGMNGYELAARLRKEPDGGNMLLVALTGYGQDEDRQRSSAAGFDEHLLKPPSWPALQKLFSHPKLSSQGSITGG
jgi:CheY-like chemotaxis protein